jgi:hypothetical protein
MKEYKMVTRRTVRDDKDAVGKSKAVALTRAQKFEKEEARARLRVICPWVIRPDEIREQAMRLLRKECTPAFTKQFGQVMLLSFQITDLYEQQTAMHPGLLKAQQNGSIEKEIWKTLDELNEAWKKLIKMP